MAELIHKKKTILSNMAVARNSFSLSIGLMFASKKKINKGLCLVMPGKDTKYGAAITMWFCFHSMEILFVNSSFKVVDKKILRPWTTTYIPKSQCKYVIESTVGSFDSILVGDYVSFSNFNKYK